MVTPYLVLLLLIALERGVELLISRRNAAAVRARGAKEAGRGHFPFMVAVHAAFLPACALEVLLLDRPFRPLLAGIMLALVVLAQVVRYLAVSALGDRWNVRVLVVPGEPPVRSGPYRYLRHPNYAAVLAEAFAIPLVHGAWLTAITFSILNAVLLFGFRIPVEARALAAAASDRPA